MKKHIGSRLFWRVSGACALIAGMVGVWSGAGLPGHAVASAASAATGPRTLAADMVPAIVQNKTAPLVGAHAAGDKLLVLFMLPFKDSAGLDAFLAQTGDPSSPLYHHYLTQDEANARFNPDVAHESRVVDWLHANGATDVQTQLNHVFVQAQLSTQTAESLLGITINDYRDGTRVFYSPDRPATLPAGISGDVTYVGGLNNATLYKTDLKINNKVQGKSGSVSSPQQAYLCPAAFAEAYDVSPLLNSGVNGTGIGVAITLWTTAPSDGTLNSWASQCGGSPVATRANGRLHEIFTEGSASGDTGDGEASLDIESVSGLAAGASVSYYEAKQPQDSNLATALNQAGTNTAIRLISNSWGAPEDSSGVNTIDPVLRSNSATGHVYLFSSGDDGSWADPGNGGQDPYPNYPTSSQYVLSVGGTVFATDITPGGGYPDERTWDYDPTGNNGHPEGSGGGYSRITARPSWQVAPGLAPNGKRGYPDVAADADPNSGAFICGDHDGCTDIGGTSLACPLWAAMLAIADQKIHADRGVYLTNAPQTFYALYATASNRAALHDIIEGTNGAYAAAANWDAVTGLGSPDLAALIPVLEVTLAGPAPTATTLPSPSPTNVPGQVFNDVPPSNTFYAQINWAYNNSIIAGYQCGNPEPCPGLFFRPVSNASRGQVAKMLVLATGLGNEAPGTQAFSDVPPSSPFYNYIQIAAHHGWVGGYGDGTYRPGVNVSRGQFSKMVSSAASYLEDIPATRQTFQDVPNGSTYWVYVERAYEHGLINGYTCGSAPDIPCVGPTNRSYFRVGTAISRGQLAKIISKGFGGP